MNKRLFERLVESMEQHGEIARGAGESVTRRPGPVHPPVTGTCVADMPGMTASGMGHVTDLTDPRLEQNSLLASLERVTGYARHAGAPESDIEAIGLIVRTFWPTIEAVRALQLDARVRRRSKQALNKLNQSKKLSDEDRRRIHAVYSEVRPKATSDRQARNKTTVLCAHWRPGLTAEQVRDVIAPRKRGQKKGS